MTENAETELSAKRERAALAKMVYEAVRFSLWAAGQGICPDRSDDADAPEDFLFAYSSAVDIEEWEGLPDVARDAMIANSVSDPT